LYWLVERSYSKVHTKPDQSPGKTFILYMDSLFSSYLKAQKNSLYMYAMWVFQYSFSSQMLIFL